MKHICTCMHTALHLTFWNRGWIIRKSLPEQWSREGNKENIWNKKSCGCVDWSWGSRQWRRELYGLIVLCRQGIEDDEEAFPWECCSSWTDTFPYLLPGEKQTLAAHMKGSFPASVWAVQKSNRALIKFERQKWRTSTRPMLSVLIAEPSVRYVPWQSLRSFNLYKKLLISSNNSLSHSIHLY